MKIRKKAAKTPMGKMKSLVMGLFNSNIQGKKKIIVLGIILYIISPLDIIPDFIPLVGYADDILLPILFFVAQHLLTENPQEMEENKLTMKEAEKI